MAGKQSKTGRRSMAFGKKAEGFQRRSDATLTISLAKGTALYVAEFGTRRTLHVLLGTPKATNAFADHVAAGNGPKLLAELAGHYERIPSPELAAARTEISEMISAGAEAADEAA